MAGLFSCENNTPIIEKKPVQSAEVQLSDSLKIIEFYKSTLPCVDCPGIIQQLWLMRKEISDTSGLYLLREIITDGVQNHEQVINTRGSWYRTNNNLLDQEGKFIELIGDSTSGFESRFYEATKNGVELLGKKGRRLKSKQNYELKKTPW